MPRARETSIGVGIKVEIVVIMQMISSTAVTSGHLSPSIDKTDSMSISRLVCGSLDLREALSPCIMMAVGPCLHQSTK